MVHVRADEEWEQAQKTPAAAAASIQVGRLGPQGAGSLGEKLNQGQAEAAQRLEQARKEWQLRTDAAVEKAKNQAGHTDWLRIALPVTLAGICAVAMAVASASAKRFMEALQVVLERIFGAPVAVLRYLRPMPPRVRR
jgi:hypothetical protein